MTVKELVEKLKQLPQDDTIAIVSKFYDFFCEDFDVRPPHDDSSVQVITLPYYINDFEKAEDW